MNKNLLCSTIFRTQTKLTVVFIILQIISAILYITQPIPLNNLTVEFSTNILFSWAIWKGILFFLFAQALIYFIFIVVLSIIVFYFSQVFNFTDKTTKIFAICYWLLTIVTIFLLNQKYFPWSIFALLPHTLPSMILQNLLLSITAFIVLAVALIAICRLFYLSYKKFGIIKNALAIIVALVIAIIWHDFTMSPPIESSDKPNVVIIGIDSLRPDLTDINNHNNSITPHLDSFLENASIFTHAYTPLARTFSAWISILTSEFPKTNGVRYSLPDMNTLNFPNTIAWQLKKAGYTTIFSSDDRRFNNIQKKFGFDDVIAPHTGFNDFILGTLNDFPLTNLIINTKLGKLLFPYSYANRGADVTYYPQTYISHLQNELAKVPQRPVFLAVHLTLPHWPFDFANAKKYKHLSENERIAKLYLQATAEADDQFAMLINVLQKQHILDHALVIVMSDHGQSLGLANETAVDPKKYIAGKNNLSKEQFNKITQPTYGHGTDILNIKQQNIVFAWKTFGEKNIFMPGDFSQPASLIDISPTILNYLNLPELNHIEGISLLPWLINKNYPQKTRDFFVETEFTLPALMVANPQINKLLKQGLNYFRVDPKNGFVIIKENFGKMVIFGKQRAVIQYPWILACYPFDQHHETLVLANIQSQAWTTDMSETFASNANAKNLYHQLQKFYGDELRCKW